MIVVVATITVVEAMALGIVVDVVVIGAVSCDTRSRVPGRGSSGGHGAGDSGATKLEFLVEVVVVMAP